MIEMLVVIAIIGIIAALAVFGMQNTFKNTRDAQRKSDLKQFQTALENGANAHNGFFPGRAGGGAPGQSVSLTVICTDLSLTNCPTDPKGPALTNSYRYQDNGSSGTWNGTKNVMWALMENDYDGNSVNTDYWVVCSSGKSGIINSTATIDDGICPI